MDGARRLRRSVGGACASKSWPVHRIKLNALIDAMKIPVLALTVLPREN